MPPAAIETELLTVEDYRATPEGARYQLVEGELYVMSPAPNRFHQDIVLNVAEILRGFLRLHPLGKVYIAPCDVYLSPHNVVQPDVFFVSTANSNILADDGIHGPPDLVIEIVSPTTAQLDKKTKRAVYARAGVKELWLIDPILRQIHLYDFARHAGKAVRILDDDESFESVLLPGLKIAAADVFKQ
jgi:Uma2 family endonuclease